MPNRKMVTEELRLLRDFLLRAERKAFKENNNRTINVLMHYRNIVIDALTLLKEQPELIRCKDCKYFHEFEPSEICKRIFHDETSYECWNPRLTDQDNVPTKGPNWFCADGERGEQDALDNSKC